ncbi:putative late blight resistance protein homolog R1A-10 [Salvia hispanica]|uniref:putative late blight resistance protein homolog R1A-10 n=1 Tax=Salvia hispanica TaxID=49212 RepID=UPI002008EF41|nr:putative late blight resistance protein homolog R1A-10 [Salvia hispanica]
MAEAATEFLLNNLREVVKHHAHLIRDAKGDIEKLERDLNTFRAFLEDTAKMGKKNEKIMNMWKEIHDVVFEVEDVVDFYLAKANEEGRQGRFARLLKNRATTLQSVGQKVESIKGRVDVMKNEISFHRFDEGRDETPQPRPPRKTDVVGFEDVAEELKQRLLQETDYFDVISLIGMLGLGKTTLAWKIYNDQGINLRFPTRIWVSVSQQFTDKEIFLRILKELTTLDDELYAKSGSELADIVAAHLQQGRFLMVLDDVWSDADWSRLRVALPHSDTNPRAKVLLTSRHKQVGVVASKPRPIKELRFLTAEESWELFRLEALSKLECPYELEPSGRIIAENCGGLPLAIVVIGGILSKSLDSNVDKTKRDWTKVSKQVISYIDWEDETKRVQKFISLSYENLPHHLRHCFLYLGLFPEDYEISASKLIRMWIGEGFIQQKDEYNSLEEIGYKYLQNLISRNLLRSAKLTPDGNVKTCQIHGVLRDFCRKEAATENFLQEIKYNDKGICVAPTSNTCRRLSIHSNLSHYISSKPSVPRVRSFVCLSDTKHTLAPQESANVIRAFKLLRVFDVQPLQFSTVAREFYNLVHLRYIAMSFTMETLPLHFSKLWNTQTLIIDTTSPTLKVEADIWKMKQLRHFKTKASAKLPNSTSSSDSADELQTLSLISVESCTKELPRRAPNLKKLGIRGKLTLLFKGEVGSFDTLRNMEHLGKLKLVNDEQQESGELNCLPRYDQFPSGLTSLTLCSTSLSWIHISTLVSLEKLKVLKLKDRAFMGHTWEAKDGCFRSLEFLHIEQTDLALWEASSNHYPKLRSLVLKNCDKLHKIPIELADIASFEMLEVSTCILAVTSAIEISDKVKKRVDGASEFTLSIFPPLHKD